jgi:PAS domain S-box-containing protein
MQRTDVGASGAAGAFTARSARQAPRFAGRYDIVKTLKQGNGVSTQLAVDSTTALQVVLKTFEATALHATAHTRFVHETRVLRELSGVGLCALHDAGQTDTHLYLAQQYAPGVTLEQALREGPLSVVATLGVGVAVAAALDLAHGAGVYHRDVKPANIIVDRLQPAGTFESVTLIDFGFARSPWLDETIRDDLVGTVRYLSPEAAGLLPSTADERSDLYAFGVVLFECLTGRPPFDGPTVGDLLRQHLNTPVPDLIGTPSPVPGALAALIQRLLRKDPAERYQSAAAVGADLAQILAAIEAGDPDPPIVIGRHDRRLTLTDPAFVGRDAELASLTMVATGLSGDEAGIVLLDADSGGGKSRLFDEVAKRATEAGVTVLHGQGIALAGQRPFTLLHGVADDLIAELARDPQRGAALASELEDVAPAIVRALPALSGLLGAAAENDTGPEQFGELRSLAGLRRMLSAIPTADHPVLIILDDCQWSDALTVRLLAELFAEAADAPRHLGVIAGFRSEEVPLDHPLRAIPAAHTIHLGPLSRRSVALLAESMSGPLPAEAIDTVVRLADGNPFMAGAVLHGLVESEAIVAGPAGWVVDPTRLPDAQAARRSAAFLVRRLELLGEDALELLSVGAVLGKQFDIETAVTIAGQVVDADDILADARRRRLVWLDESGDSCTFFHDKIRESLLARLDEDLRRELHGRAADALIATAGDEPGELAFDLAYHLHAAGRGADALPYALAAAELARSRYALDVATAHYRMARESVSPADVVTWRLIAEGLGDVLMLEGVYGEARTQLLAARELADEPSQAAALDGKLGALAFKQGDIPTAKERLEGALKLLGRWIPRRAALLPCLIWELLVQMTHTLLPRLTTGRRSADNHEDDFLAMRLYSRLAYLYWFHSGKVACAWTHLRGMNLAERYGPSAELGQAWSEHAPVMTMLPWYRRGVRYAQRSLDIRRELGDVWGQGQSLNFTGVARYAASDFEHAQAACEEAIQLLRRTGDQWEVNTASWNLALCLLRTGDLRQTVDVCRETFEAARTIGDQTAAGIALSIWARATEGRIPGELVRELLEHGGEDAQTTAELHLADALVHRADGDLPGALECLDRGTRTIQDAGLRQEYIAPVFAWHATVLREYAQASPQYAPEVRAERLKAAAAATRSALRWARFYRNNEPHVRREAALVAAMQGRHRVAFRQLERSRAAAERIGARYEQALTHLATVEVRAAQTDSSFELEVAVEGVRAFDPTIGHTSGDPGGESAISIFDRFATLLKVGRAIAAAPTEAALERAIRESTLALLRAERCHLVPIAALSDHSLTTQSGEGIDGLSQSLLVEAATQGRPVAALDETADSTDSLVLSGIRSAMAAPISVQGEVRSLLYVTHTHLGELFGEEEAQLAAFIATLSGAAYEHLLGSETRFRALVQSSSDVITLVDPDGVVIYQSAALQTVFGLPAVGLVGLPISHWVHPDDVERLEYALAAVASGEESSGTRVECRLEHADGSYRFVETAVTNLLEEPTVSALVLNTRDITERTVAVDQLRVAEERERIARDLHDVVIQRLFAVGLSLDSMSGRLARQDARQVIAAADELHYTIRDIRGAIFTLRSDSPDLPLTARLHAVVERAAQTLGFVPEVVAGDEIDQEIPEALHWHLIATVNEALSNVAKHARATKVLLTITVADSELTASVMDDGVGLPEERTESGLVNLRRRAQVAGGTMTTAPGSDGAGLVLTWRVPMPNADG